MRFRHNNDNSLTFPRQLYVNTVGNFKIKIKLPSRGLNFQDTVAHSIVTIKIIVQVEHDIVAVGQILNLAI